MPNNTGRRGGNTQRGGVRQANHNIRGRGGFGGGRGGKAGGGEEPKRHQDLKELPHPAPSAFGWEFEVPQDEQEAILKTIKNDLVVPRHILETYGHYKHLYKPKHLGGEGLSATRAEINNARICTGCEKTKLEIEGNGNLPCTNHPKLLRNKQDPMKCDGCGQNISTPGCRKGTSTLHQYGGVPSHLTSNKFFLSAFDAKNKKSPWLVIDVEFILQWTNAAHTEHTSYAGWIAIVDGLSGTVLCHTYCMPVYKSQIKSLQTKWSGIFLEDLNRAQARKNVIYGLSDLNKLLSRWADDRTILSFHAAAGDLKSMKLCAGPIVDSQMICAGVRGNKTPKLKYCALDLLGIGIQADNFHDPLEDAMATRELILRKARAILAETESQHWFEQTPGVDNDDLDLGEDDDDFF